MLEIPPAKEEKGRFTRTLQNGSGSRTDQQAKAGKGKAKAKGRARKAAMATEGVNLCATIGARGMGIAAMLPPATSLMMVLREASKEKGKEQHRYRQKP